MLLELFCSLVTSIYFIGFAFFLLALTGGVYYYFTRNFGKWEAQYGIKGLKPVPFFGTEKDMLTGKVSLADFIVNRYKEFTGHK
jgi:hypothetical protein